MMIFGLIGICILLITLGLLSRRFGEATDAKPHYLGLFVGAFLVGVGVIVRVLYGDDLSDLNDGIVGLLLYYVSPALGVTIGLGVAWRYWSWLIAERE
jgi:predicted permease